MSKSLFGAAAVALALAASAANAADFPAQAYSAPFAANSYKWAGPYLGGNLGYQWGNTTRNPTDPWGFAGGVQGGYSWQWGPWVLGGEGDVTVSAAHDTFAPWKFSNPWFGTARVRAGYALNNILFYGTAGLAVGEGRAQSFGLTEHHTHAGWAGGAGMEVGLTPRWSARVEYLFVDLGGRTYVLTGANNGFESSLLRLGFNYRF